jgi:hypothetical protein
MIIITKYTQQRSSTIGAWLYWHTIQYKEGGYRYDCTMSDEGMMYLIKALSQDNVIDFATDTQRTEQAERQAELEQAAMEVQNSLEQ